jgi:hypothetical protein
MGTITGDPTDTIIGTGDITITIVTTTGTADPDAEEHHGG